MTQSTYRQLTKTGQVFYTYSPGSHYGPHFKPIQGRYRPTRGGRWQVRKVWDPRTNDWCWRAWTSGRAREYNMNFQTQQDAFQWASLVARFHMINDWSYFQDLYRAHKALKRARLALTRPRRR